MAGDIDDLVTVRDWLRRAVSLFNAAKLSFGHGTQTAQDDAAFLILTALYLPIDQLEPWLDCRLTRQERSAIAGLLEKRITSRKPAAYLVNAAWIGPYRFFVDERTIVPRSYIGELLVADGLGAVIDEPDAVGRVLDLCTGGGSLAILAAHAFPDATIDAADLSRDALAVAERNVADYRLCDRINVVESDLFAALAGRTYDLILCNPPYVAAAEVAAFPPEYAAEPPMAHAGGHDGLDLVRKVIRQAGQHLNDGGSLILEIGTGRDVLEAEFPTIPFLWLDTEISSGEVLALGATDLVALV